MITNAEREYLIERYMNGEMSPAEQRQFMERAQKDPELHRHLQAEQLIGSAVRHDRAAIGGPSAGSRAQFLTMLATVSSEIPATAPSSAGGGSSPLRYLPGARRTQGIVAAVAGVALIVGAIVVAPRLQSPRQSRPQAPRENTVSVPSAPRITEPQAPAATPAPEAQKIEERPAETGPARAAKAPAREIRSNTKRTAEHTRSTEAARTKPAQKPDGGPTVSDTEAKGSINKNKPKITSPSEKNP